MLNPFCVSFFPFFFNKYSLAHIFPTPPLTTARPQPPVIPSYETLDLLASTKKLAQSSSVGEDGKDLDTVGLSANDVLSFLPLDDIAEDSNIVMDTYSNLYMYTYIYIYIYIYI